MKIEVNGKSFEFTLDGKDLEGNEIFEAFIALGSSFFPFAVITRGTNDDAPVRAVTFSSDEEYANKLLELMEPELGPDEEIGLLALEGSDEDDGVDV